MAEGGSPKRRPATSKGEIKARSGFMTFIYNSITCCFSGIAIPELAAPQCNCNLSILLASKLFSLPYSSRQGNCGSIPQTSESVQTWGYRQTFLIDPKKPIVIPGLHLDFLSSATLMLTSIIVKLVTLSNDGRFAPYCRHLLTWPYPFSQSFYDSKVGQAFEFKFGNVL